MLFITSANLRSLFVINCVVIGFQALKRGKILIVPEKQRMATKMSDRVVLQCGK